MLAAPNNIISIYPKYVESRFTQFLSLVVSLFDGISPWAWQQWLHSSVECLPWQSQLASTALHPLTTATKHISWIKGSHALYPLYYYNPCTCSYVQDATYTSLFNLISLLIKDRDGKRKETTPTKEEPRPLWKRAENRTALFLHFVPFSAPLLYASCACSTIVCDSFADTNHKIVLFDDVARPKGDGLMTTTTSKEPHQRTPQKDSCPLTAFFEE